MHVAEIYVQHKPHSHLFFYGFYLHGCRLDPVGDLALELLFFFLRTDFIL